MKHRKRPTADVLAEIDRALVEHGAQVAPGREAELVAEAKTRREKRRAG